MLLFGGRGKQRGGGGTEGVNGRRESSWWEENLNTPKGKDREKEADEETRRKDQNCIYEGMRRIGEEGTETYNKCII